MRRVVITGMGAITPIGLNVNEYWEGLKAGKTGFGEITYFDTTDYKVKIAAEVKDFVPKNYMDGKAAKRMENFPSTRLPLPKKQWSRPALIWKKKIPIGWAV